MNGALAFLERRFHDDDLELLAERLGSASFEREYELGHTLTDEAAVQLGMA